MNRTESRAPEINYHVCSQQIFDKGFKNIQWGKNSLFNSDVGKMIFTCKRVKLDLNLKPLTKMNSKWIKYLNVRPETVKLLEENIGEKLLDIVLGNNFWI